jgi:hypothetical protein
MTSFTKALYRRDPAAAEAFRRHSKLDRLVYGKVPTLACFTMADHQPPAQDGRKAAHIEPEFDVNASLQRFADRSFKPRTGFGQRTPTGVVGCATRCGHPGCAQGCTLQGRKA